MFSILLSYRNTSITAIFHFTIKVDVYHSLYCEMLFCILQSSKQTTQYIRYAKLKIFLDKKKENFRYSGWRKEVSDQKDQSWDHETV